MNVDDASGPGMKKIKDFPLLDLVGVHSLRCSTTGARIDRWDNGRHVSRHHARFIEATKLERSSRYLCSEACITFISKPHDEGPGSDSCALHLNLFHVATAFLLQTGMGFIIAQWTQTDGTYPAEAHQRAMIVLIALEVLAFAWFAVATHAYGPRRAYRSIMTPQRVLATRVSRRSRWPGAKRRSLGRHG